MKRTLLLFLLTIGLTAYVNAQEWVVYDGSVSPDSVFDANGSGTLDDTIINDPMIAGNKLYKYVVSDGTFNWRADLAAPLKGITLVARIRADLDPSYQVVNFSLRNGEVRPDIRVEDDKLNPNGTNINANYDIDMTGWHVIRITLADDSALMVYVDEKAMPVMVDTGTSASTDMYIQWGDGSGSDNYGGLIDWMIFDTTGVYAPGEGMAIPDSLSLNHQASIIFITDDNNDDPNVEFLQNNGFKVTKFWPGALSAAGQDTIDMLNDAELVIIGRSPNSGDFDGADQPVWNAVKAPLLLCSPWVARSSRLKWFNSTTAVQINVTTGTLDATAVIPGDPIFAGVTLVNDMMTWSFLADDYILVKEASNGTWVADRGDTIPLVVRFEPNIQFYDGAGDSAAGPRTYFGMGNDAAGPVHYFPLTRDAMSVYLAEVSRMVGNTAPEATNYTSSDYNIILLTDDNNDDEQYNFLLRQGFKVTKFWPGLISEAGQDTIDMLNAADLLIVGRSPNSGDFDGADQPVWNALTAPLILNTQWAARSSRLKWFNSTTCVQINVSTGTTIGKAVLPDDQIFDGIDLVGDSIEWSYLADDYILVKEPSNGTWVADRGDTIPLIVRFEPNIQFYDGAGDSAAGPRTYFGFGNDAAGPINFFPLTNEVKKIYLAEISRMLNFPAPEIIYGAPDFHITFITDDLLDQPAVTFLQKNGFKVKTFWPGLLSAAGQDTVDMINASDLVIIGRSPSSGDFDGADQPAWNAITAPLILNSPWVARNNRLKWFNSSTCVQINQTTGTTMATAVIPNDPVFEFAPSIQADHTMEWSYLADDYIDVREPFNGEVVVNRGDTIPIVVRFQPNIQFYDGAGDSAAGPRTYFGMGNDAAGPIHFFPLTKNGEAVYLAEALRLCGAPPVAAVYLGENRALASLAVSSGTLSPAFNADSLSYTVDVTGVDSVEITAAAAEATSVVTGTGWVKTPPGTTNATVRCTAENARFLNYVISFTRVTGVEEFTNTENNCSIYPNPVNDKVVISAPDNITNISVYSLQGAVVFSKKVNGRTVELSLSELNAGVYFVKVQSGNNVYVNKITKN